MGLSDRIKKEIDAIKKVLGEDSEKLKRLKAYSPKDINRIDKQIQAVLRLRIINEGAKKDLGEARNCLISALDHGSRLRGADKRENVLNRVVELYKMAARCIDNATQLM